MAARNLEAIFFDLDGVLIDSVPLQVEAFRRFFAKFGVPFGPEALERFNGPSSREILTIMRGEHGLTYDVEEALAERTELAGKLLAEARPFPQARETVDAFRLRGYRIGLTTSAPRTLAEQLCGDWDFDVTICGEDVPHAKPDPGIFLRAAQRLGLLSRACAAVDDSPLGIEAARAAGMFAVGVATTSPGKSLEADVVVESVAGLLELPQLFARDVLFRPPHPLAADRVQLELRPDRQVVPAHLRDEIERAWQKTMASGRAFNAECANLLHVEAQGDSLLLRANRTDYKTYAGLRGLPNYDIATYGICVLGTSGLLITADRQAVFARRGQGLVGQGHWYNLPGGLLSVDHANSVRDELLRELREEVGLEDRAVRACTFLGIGHDQVSKGAELLFVLEVDQSLSEVVRQRAAAVDAYESYDLRGVPLADLPAFAAVTDLLPASRTLVELFLTAQG